MTDIFLHRLPLKTETIFMRQGKHVVLFKSYMIHMDTESVKSRSIERLDEKLKIQDRSPDTENDMV